MMRIASSIEVTPTAVNCAVITGWRQDAGHERGGGQVVELVGLGALDRVEQRHLVEQVALQQRDVVARSPSRFS